MPAKIGAAALMALGLAIASVAALADDKRNDCLAAGGETVNGMPATKHQEEVLGKQPNGSGTQGQQQQACATDNGMPASPHQENTLDTSKPKGRAACPFAKCGACRHVRLPWSPRNA